MSNESDTEAGYRTTRKRKRSDSSSDSSDSPFQPDRNRRRLLRSASESSNCHTDCLLHRPAAGFQQILNNNDSGYESEPKDWDDECITADEVEDISRYKSTDYFRAESCGDYDFGRSQETGISDEISTSYRQHGTASTTESTGRSSKKSDDSFHQPGTTSTSEGKGGSSEESDVSSCQIGDASTPEERERISEEINAYSRQSGAACTAEETGRGSGEFYKFPHEPGAASTTEESVGSSGEFRISLHEPDAASTTEQIGERTEEVATSPLQPGAASTTEERQGKPEEFGYSLHEPDASSTTEESVGSSGEFRISLHEPDAAFTTEERVGRSGEVCISPNVPGAAPTIEGIEGSSGEVGVSPHQPGAASATWVDGEAASSTSSSGTLPAAYVSYSSSDGDSDKCPICLVTIAEQEVGTPDSCDHIFCVGCLKKWSKVVNTCPVDRQVFNVILVRRYSDREIIRRIAVRSGQQGNQYAGIVQQDTHFCQFCGQCDREDHMITCNGCRLVYHVDCLISLLYVVPVVEGLCPVCITLGSMFLRGHGMARVRRI